MFDVELASGAISDLARLRAHDRVRLLDAIETRLGRQPLTPSRNCKELIGLVPPWDQVRPVWELRVGDFRVFYDVDMPARLVVVQAVRRKGRRATGEIL